MEAIFSLEQNLLEWSNVEVHVPTFVKPWVSEEEGLENFEVTVISYRVCSLQVLFFLCLEIVQSVGLWGISGSPLGLCKPFGRSSLCI